MTECVFLRRTEQSDDLWTNTDMSPAELSSWQRGEAPPAFENTPGFKLAQSVSAAPVGPASATARRLLEHHFRNIAYECAPKGFLAPGLVDKTSYQCLLDDLGAEYESNVAKAVQTSSNIVTVAKKLGLHVRTSGKAPWLWFATCPSTNHHLHLNADTDEYVCGYCRRSGDVTGLCQLVEEREVGH